MNARVLWILKIFISMAENEYVLLASLAHKLRVSLRTIQKDMNVIKNILESYNLQIESFRGKGMRLKGSKEQKSILKNMIQAGNGDLFNLSEADIRRKRIMLKLLTTSVPTSINKLAEEYYVSRTSIVKALDEIGRWLKSYAIVLHRTNEGTYIAGPEKMIRMALAILVKELIAIEENENCFADLANVHHSSYSICRLSLLFPDINIEKLNFMLLNIEKENGYYFTDASYTGLMLHLLIMIKRNSMPNISISVMPEEEAKTPIDWYFISLAKNITRRIGNTFNVKISYSDEKYIYQHLMCSGVPSGLKQEDVEMGNEKVLNFVKVLIQNIGIFLNVSLIEDKELIDNLNVHCIAMFERIYYGKNNPNPLLYDIKENYSGLFGVILLAVQETDGVIYKKITSDEIGYLTIHVQAAIERIVTPRKAIVVCPEGIGFSQLIYSRVKKYIPLLKIIDVIPYNRIHDFDLKQVDLVLSTKKLKVDKPVIIVSSFADLPDIKRINNYLVGMASAGKNQALMQLVTKNMVFLQQRFECKEEIFAFLCEKMVLEEYVTDKFLASINERESVMSTEIGRGVSIPHGSKDYVKKSTVGIVTLQKPIKWQETYVDCIFLLAINLEDVALNKRMLNDLYNIIDSSDKIVQLKKCSDFSEIENVFFA